MSAEFGDSIKFCNPEKKRIKNCVFYFDILDDGVDSLGRMNIVKSAAPTTVRRTRAKESWKAT